jgi:pimeloyl-ACP methyl ester carboxylesterase
VAKHTVIVHGWSDCSESFQHLKGFLVANGLGKVHTVYYADYESREDNVTFSDVVGGLNDELRRNGLIDEEGHGDFNVIVHSTGGLVIRHWIWRYYADRIDECPVKNLVMLAPANFGSPLAHRGKSFLGQLFKGRWKIGDMLEVGRQLLDGLELASPYQWWLAERDLFRAQPFYDADRIRLTVLVGLDDYTGLRGWVNKPGTDGTVVIAGTPLNSVRLRLDFSNRRVPFMWQKEVQLGTFAFGALPGYDHGTIVGAFEHHRVNPEQSVLQYLLRAVRVGTEAQFRRLVADLERETQAASTGGNNTPRQYQQFLVRATDDQGAPIRDYTLEFLVRERRRTKRKLSDQINEIMGSEFHTFTGDSSYRRFLVDGAAVAQIVPSTCVLALRMHVPRVDRGIFYDTKNSQDIVLWDRTLSAGQGPTFFYPSTTTLLELVVDRVTKYVRVGTKARGH